MSFFEKLGLVARDEDPGVGVGTNVSMEELTPVDAAVPAVADVSAEVESATNVVAEIYEQNGLAGNGDSIFTIQALIDTLPDTMPTATMQTTVAGILAVSGKSLDNLLADAQTRIDTLDVACDAIVDEQTTAIGEAERDIEAMKAAIEVAQGKIKAANELIAGTKQSVDAEIAVINGLINFCEGMKK